MKPKTLQPCFQSSGDLGDIIFSLAVVKHLGGGYYNLVDRPWTKALIPRAPLIEPLLRSQDYISDVTLGERADATHDFSTFRQGGLVWGASLARLHAKWLGIPEGAIDFTKPWLRVPKTPGYEDKVVIARSPRYHAPYFPWKEIAEFLGPDQAVFLGLAEEHAEFVRMTGVPIPRVETANLLEAAGIITGAHHFIGNQSSPNAIAEGLKVPRILEVCHWAPDCLLGGGNVQYSCEGEVFLTAPDGRELDIPARELPREIRTDIVPPGGWTYLLPDGEEIRTNSFPQCAFLIRHRLPHLTVPESEKEVLVYTLNKFPDLGVQPWHVTHQQTVRKLRQIINQTHQKKTTI